MTERENMNQQPAEILEQLPPGKPLNLVLVGKTGQGKSETGNTIFGGDFFPADDGAVSVTRTNKARQQTVGGRVINIVDTPGCMDTEKGQEILNEIATAVTEHPEGYDAFLIVLRYPLRMTTEEMKTIDDIAIMFGEEVYKYAVLVFTHGDAFNAKQAKSQSPITFEEYVNRDLQSASNHTLGPLIKKVGKRVVLFNNMELDKAKCRAMIIELVQKIDHTGPKERYNNDIFQKAKELKLKGVPDEDRAKRLSAYIRKKFPACVIL